MGLVERFAYGQNSRWHADGNSAGWNINNHDRVGADLRVVANHHRTQHLGACSDVHMASNPGKPRMAGPSADGHLLKQHAVGAKRSFGVNNNPVRMHHDQAAPQFLTVQRYIRRCHDAPEAVPNRANRSDDSSNWTETAPPLLISSDAP